jgi:hypothetical protein
VTGIYRALLRLYPKSFRSSFGAEILGTLSRLEADRATGGRTRGVISSGVEIAGLLAGSCVERFRLRRSEPVRDAIAEAEASVRFHLAQTVDCIAHHRFEGARFHAREEARARERVSTLQQSST